MTNTTPRKMLSDESRAKMLEPVLTSGMKIFPLAAAHVFAQIKDNEINLHHLEYMHNIMCANGCSEDFASAMIFTLRKALRENV